MYCIAAARILEFVRNESDTANIPVSFENAKTCRLPGPKFQPVSCSNSGAVKNKNKIGESGLPCGIPVLTM
jgi:hypothetical protein